MKPISSSSFKNELEEKNQKREKRRAQPKDEHERFSTVKQRKVGSPQLDETLKIKIDSTTEKIAGSGVKDKKDDIQCYLVKDLPDPSSQKFAELNLKECNVELFHIEQMPLVYYVGSLIAFASFIHGGVVTKCQRCSYEEKFLSIEKFIEKLENHFEKKHPSDSTWNGYCGICMEFVEECVVKNSKITITQELEHIIAKHEELLKIR